MINIHKIFDPNSETYNFAVDICKLFWLRNEIRLSFSMIEKLLTGKYQSWFNSGRIKDEVGAVKHV